MKEEQDRKTVNIHILYIFYFASLQKQQKLNMLVICSLSLEHINYYTISNNNYDKRFKLTILFKWESSLLQQRQQTYTAFKTVFFPS